MEQKSNFLVMMILIAFTIGLLVILMKPDYTFEQVIHSNQNYYPSVKVSSIHD